MTSAVYTADDALHRNRNNRRWFLFAIAISFLVHVLLFELSRYQKLPGAGYYDQLLGRAFKVQTVEMDPPKAPPDVPRDATRDPGTNFRAPDAALTSPPPFPVLKPDSSGVTQPPPPSSVKMIEKKQPLPGTQLPVAARDASLDARRSTEILAIQKENLKENISTEGRPILEIQPGQAGPEKPDLVRGGAPTPLPMAAGSEGEPRPALPGTGPAVGSPTRGGAGGTGLIPIPVRLPEVDAAKKIPLREGDKLLREDISGERPYPQLSPWMDIELFTYEEKSGSGTDGYFMLRITAKENNILKVIPKDVTFIIDSSSSIGKSRLYEFKSGVTRSLENLNPDDRFNLLSFKKKSQWLSKTYLPATAASRADAKTFFREVHSAGRTDIFRALLPLTGQKPDPGRMRMAILMSDGLATEGERSAARIINQFTARNLRVTSLFALSGGPDVNPFLLEFLAYQNQGLTLYVRDENQISHQFYRFYLSIKDPLLMDLDFKFAGVHPEEVYPQNLPHIYQNTPLHIYGRYDPQKDKVFSMQILGRSFGTTKELLARQAFDQSKRGTRQIALDWGKQKTYHLIGRTLRHDSPELEDEIRRLSRDYGVELRWMD